MTNHQQWPHEVPDGWELNELRQLRAAIHDGRVDGFVVRGDEGDLVYTLTGADRPYRQFLETMADGAATVAMDGTVLFANRRLARLVDTPLGELVGSDLHAFCTPDSSARLDVALASLGQDQFRAVLTTRAGRQVPALVSAAHLDLDGQRVTCIVVADLTSQEQAGRQLELQARLLDAAGEAIIATDALGVVTYTNVAAQQLYGWSQAEMLGRSVLDLNVGPDNAEQAAKIMQQLAQGKGWSGEFIVHRKDGSSFPAHVTDTPLVNADGVVIGIIGISRDVTARRQAEERLEASERWFRTLIASSSDLIAVVDAEARLLYASPSGSELLGWDPEAKLGDPMLELVHPDDLESVTAGFADVLASPGRAAAPLRWRGRSADGTWRTLETIATNCLHDPAVHGIVINARDVTESDRLQTALASSERLLREAQRISHTGHWQLELADDRLEWLADEVYAIHGVTKDRWGGTLTDYLELVHPDDRERLLAALRDALQRGSGEIEHRIIRPDGSVRCVRNRGVRTDGETPRLVGTCQDITDVAQARSALMERIKEQRCLSLVGMTANETDDGRELQTVTVQALPDAMQFPTQASALVQFGGHRTGTPATPGHPTMDAPILVHGRPRGHVTVAYRDRALAFVPEETKLLGAVADTLALWLARHDATTELAVSETRYRNLAESAPQGIYLLALQPQPELTYHNPALAAMFGLTYPSTAEILRIIQELRSAGSLDTPPAARAATGPVEHVAPDQRVRWLEIRESMTGHDTTTVQGLVIDVTAAEAARTALENAVRQEQDLVNQLQQVDAMKNAFLQAVSHELRTPLTSVLGMSATLVQHKGEIDGTRTQQLIEGIARNAERLRGLVEDLLDINRLTAGTIAPQRQDVPLAALIEEAAEGLDLDGQITFDLNAPMVKADAVQLRRIVHNLLLNVTRHTPAGTHIWIRSYQDEEGWTIIVEDNGPGVPDDLKPTIFEPFVQGTDSLGRARPGTGIGLHLVAQFAALHGGHAWVTDRPGGGSAFNIRLARPVPIATRRRLPAAQDPRDGTEPGRGDAFPPAIEAPI